MIDLDAFHFLRPEWLFALFPLLLLLLASYKLKGRQSGWQSVLASHLYQFLVSRRESQQKVWPFILVALGWIIAVVALAGPTWQKLPQPVYQLNAGKVVLLDMSLSMRATDIKPDRLTRAKYKAIDLINAIAEGETGLVAYAGDAFTISPLSSDAQNLTTLLPSLAPEIMPVPGSEPALGLTSAAQLLENAGFLNGDIFWITDGIDMSQVAELKTLIGSLPYRVSILAVGTEDGAPIQLVDGDFLKDNTGAIVIPKLNADMLVGLARASGGKFSQIRADDSDIETLTSLQPASREAQKDEQNSDQFGDEWEESGPLLLLCLLPLALLAFRRGYLVVVTLGVLTSLTMPQQAQAIEWQDLWKTADQQATEAFNSGDYADAAETFNDPLWKGSALYKNGDYEGALDAFSQATGVEATYNRANALAQLGRLDESLAAYDEVLKQQPDHGDALANKALVEKMKQQQEQEQKDQQDQQEGDDQQKGEDQQEGNDQQDGNQDQQNQDQQNQEQSQDQQGQQDSSEQQDEQQSDQKNQQQSSEENEQESQEQSDQQAEQESESKESQQQESQQQMAQTDEQQELTDEEKEQMQRMQNLLNRVPDDPAFLLKRKMMLEYQQRKRGRAPSQSKRNW